MTLHLELFIGAWWAHLSNRTVDKDCLRVEVGGGGEDEGGLTQGLKDVLMETSCILSQLKNMYVKIS